MTVISRLFDQFKSLRRFPVPITVAVSLSVLMNLEVAGLDKWGDLLVEVNFALVGALLAAVIVALAGEGRSLGKIPTHRASIVAVVAIAALQLLHGKLFDQSFILIGSLALGLMTAAHLRRGATNESLWNFDLKLGIAAAMGTMAFLIGCGGLLLLLASVQYLFDLSVPDGVWGHIWVTGATLIAPLFALSMLPYDLDEPFQVSSEPNLLERAVAVVLDFALAPLVLGYAAMLHVYAAKIAFTASLPKGEIGRLVLAFGGVGTATYMLAYPWREAGSRPVRWLLAGWFWLMIVPALLLAVAVWKRIEQYGITPERYLLCVFALWLVVTAAYLGSRRGRIDLRFIPASLVSEYCFRRSVHGARSVSRCEAKCASYSLTSARSTSSMATTS